MASRREAHGPLRGNVMFGSMLDSLEDRERRVKRLYENFKAKGLSRSEIEAHPVYVKAMRRLVEARTAGS